MRDFFVRIRDWFVFYEILPAVVIFGLLGIFATIVYLTLSNAPTSEEVEAALHFRARSISVGFVACPIESIEIVDVYESRKSEPWSWRAKCGDRDIFCSRTVDGLTTCSTVVYKPEAL